MAQKVQRCSEPHRYVADVAEQRLQGAQGIGVPRRRKETYRFLSPV